MIDKLLSKLTGRRHHYVITVRYTPDKNYPDQCHSKTVTAVHPRKNIAYDKEYIKTMVSAVRVAAGFFPYPRAGERIEILEVHYIGWFKPSK